jgi:hypothetical protein
MASGKSSWLLRASMPKAWHAALLHGGEAYDVPRGVDVRDLCLVEGVDSQPATIVGREAGGRQVQGARGARPADAVKRLLRDHLFPAVQVDPDSLTALILRRLYRADLFVHAQGGAAAPHLVDKRLHHLRVNKRQQAGELLDQRHADAQRREYAGVLESDDPASDHGQGPWKAVQVQYVVRGEYVGPVERDTRGLGGRGARGYHDAVGGDLMVALPVQRVQA